MRTMVVMMVMACAPSWDDSSETSDTDDFLSGPADNGEDTGGPADADADADADSDGESDSGSVWPYAGAYSGSLIMTGDTWGAWCEGTMVVTVNDSGDVEGDGSCDWDLSDLGYGTDTTAFYPSGTVSSDGAISGDVFVDAGDWGSFTGSLSGTHGESSTNLVMEFDWGGVQDQSVVFERE